MNLTRLRSGMTAIEVLASTLLAALLMTALLGVLRGLKAHESVLDARNVDPNWHATLDAVLAADFASTRSYSVTPTSLTLDGFGGRNAEGASTWLPATIVYSIESDEMSSWLVRRETTAPGGGATQNANLVLKDVREIRTGVAATDSALDRDLASTPPAAASSGSDAQLEDGLVIELWDANATKPLYRFRFHAP
jgi:hypothetical protein